MTAPENNHQGFFAFMRWSIERHDGRNLTFRDGKGSSSSSSWSVSLHAGAHVALAPLLLLRLELPLLWAIPLLLPACILLFTPPWIYLPPAPS